ncbi:MAG: DEAD/DEAH box helicase, partial [Myxococcales bacterium]|nr:DEAD/DEAH box helicase [Myxococcales bacterium]
MSTTTSPFASLGLSDDVVAAIVSAGYEAPTAVQQEGIPAFLAGGDIVFQAQTGTGKTAAFVLPIIERLVA